MTGRLTAAGTLALLGLVGCGGGSPLAGGESCAQIADDAVAATNDYIVEAGPALENFDPSAEQQPSPPAPPPELTGVEQRFEDAGCSDQEVATLLQERADQIKGEGFLAELIRGAFQAGPDGLRQLEASEGS